MDQRTFETFVRRASDLLDRRSLMGGLSAALLATGVPLAAGAKKGKHKHKHNKGKSKGCKKRVKACREGVPIFCEGNEECIDTLAPCCKKACKSLDELERCCVDVGVCTSAADAAALLG
jgi:hypothetical protein